MNTDLLRYKYRFVSLVLILGYSFLHVRLTGVYTGATLQEMIQFAARLPYGQRLLVPAIAHVFAGFLPLTLDQLFFLLEVLFVSLLFIALKELLKLEFNEQKALFLSWLFLLLLPLMSVINYRFTIEGEATFFYPADSASLFFMCFGFFLCLTKRWYAYIPWILLSTFNRESSILLVLLIPTLYWRDMKTLWMPFIAASFAYIVGRLLVVLCTIHLPGTYVEWFFRASTHTHFEANLLWLFADQNIFLFQYCMAGLPLFWFGFYDFIPPQFRAIRYLSLFYFFILMLVGNFMETRIFHELLILLYLPDCLAISAWLEGKNDQFSSSGFLSLLDRYAVLLILGLIFISRNFIDKLIVAFTRLSH